MYSGDELKKQRERTGLSLERAADMLGVTPEVIIKLESGHSYSGRFAEYVNNYATHLSALDDGEFQ
jgi:predicted transcriptional regulator